MTAAARANTFGLDSSQVKLTACWSGYWTKDSTGASAAHHDEIAINPIDGTSNEFGECTVRVYGWCPGQGGGSTIHVIDPRTAIDGSCPLTDKVVKIDCTQQFPLTSATDDMASDYAKSDGRNANQVTVVACYAWQPPLAGFLLIPETLHMVGVLTESLEYQQ